MSIIDIIAAVASAVISSMGFGGGGVLILYLTLFKNTPQLTAQGKNLFFFIPCSIVSIFVYCKNGIIKFKKILPMILGGIIGVLAGNLLLKQIPEKMLSIIFAVFLIISGISTIFSKNENKEAE